MSMVTIEDEYISKKHIRNYDVSRLSVYSPGKSIARTIGDGQGGSLNVEYDDKVIIIHIAGDLYYKGTILSRSKTDETPHGLDFNDSITNLSERYLIHALTPYALNEPGRFFRVRKSDLGRIYSTTYGGPDVEHQ